MNANLDFTGALSGAVTYQRLRNLQTGRVEEAGPESDPFSERHLHCVWFDNRLRPGHLQTERGEAVCILHPGRWNQESGPDFLDAEWTVGGRRVRGDVEIHIRPMDWKHHGHSRDPRYQRVGLHVCYEHGELPQGLLPAGCEQVALRTQLDRRSHFFFDSIDLRAYPWQKAAPDSGLRAYFAEKSEAECAQMLEAAGQERLRRKALRMARTVRAVGGEQALYTALMRGLGYKNNADPAENLARAMPVATLRQFAGTGSETAYALLLGAGGLLPADAGDSGDSGLPRWLRVRELWDLWWPRQHLFLDLALRPEVWRLDHCRPGNHPRVRLRAMAGWVAGGEGLEHGFRRRTEQTEKQWVRHCLSLLMADASEGAAGGVRLIGPVRAGTLFLNALLPWRICTADSPPDEDLWSCLPDEAFNSRTRRAARILFGPDQHPRLFRGGLRKQGLLQFIEDFQI